jgi:hypothetical protein
MILLTVIIALFIGFALGFMSGKHTQAEYEFDKPKKKKKK